MSALPIVGQPDLERTCSGHCCERFTLPFSLVQAWTSYRVSARMSRGGYHLQADETCYRNIEIIAPMLIYLGMLPIDPATGKPAPKMVHHYTCKHFDTEHRLCRIYEHRPDVCRRYPEGHCQYEGCTWEGHNKPRDELLLTKA